MKEVNRLLGQHKIPVLSGKKMVDSNGVVTLPFDVMDSESTDGYVAISHVWEDGLGNLHANEMPQCQLFRIMSLVSEVNKEQLLPF